MKVYKIQAMEKVNIDDKTLNKLRIESKEGKKADVVSSYSTQLGLPVDVIVKIAKPSGGLQVRRADGIYLVCQWYEEPFCTEAHCIINNKLIVGFSEEEAVIELIKDLNEKVTSIKEDIDRIRDKLSSI